MLLNIIQHSRASEICISEQATAMNKQLKWRHSADESNTASLGTKTYHWYNCHNAGIQTSAVLVLRTLPLMTAKLSAKHTFQHGALNDWASWKTYAGMSLSQHKSQFKQHAINSGQKAQNLHLLSTCCVRKTTRCYASKSW